MSKSNKIPLSEKGNKVSEKNEELSFGTASFYSDRLSIPASLKKEIEDQGLVYRFINKQQFSKNMNMHHSHWQPYRMKNSHVQTNLFGQNPNGYYELGDLILAVRTEDIHKQHQKFLKDKNIRAKNYTKQKAQEIKGQARSAGVKITEGYD